VKKNLEYSIEIINPNVKGQGDFPRKGDRIRIRYSGKYLDGRVHSKSKKPFDFVMGAN
jgi:FKBP-type peptidyl-prolyl cis-trans isomerase